MTRCDLVFVILQRIVKFDLLITYCEHLVGVILCLCSMDATISNALHEEVMSSFRWIQDLIFQPNNESPVVNLAEAVGILPEIPTNCYDQPENNKYLSGSCFRLPSNFHGPDASQHVKSFFDDICEGASLTMARGVYSLKGRKCLDIVCSCGRINKNAKNITFTDGMNSKKGTKRESVKRQRTPNQEHIVNVMPRWDKKKNNKKTKRQEKTMKVVDTREGVKSTTVFQARRNGGKMPAKEEYLCKFKLKVVMDTATNHWWLMSDSHIEHSHHPPVNKEAQKGSSSDITPEQMKFVMQMYRNSIPPSTMSHIMSNLVGKEFTADTISNLTKKCQEAMDVANGISPNLSSAQKTLERLRA